MSNLSRYCLAVTFITAGNLSAQAVSPAINDTASRIFGQTKLQLVSFAPNLVEGRELSNPQAIAFDTSVTPAIVYVSDTGNNRVLAWRNASSLSKGNPADLVIGQRKGDFATTFAQVPGSANSLSTGLNAPGGLAVDRQGNLYVCDSGNNRILRYPAPFNQTGDLLQVNLVIGQRTVSAGRNPNQGLSAATAKTIAFANANGVFTTGLALDADGNLWATDPLNNRVLRYPVASLAPDTPEPAADLVLGQPDFISNAAPVAPSAIQQNKVNLSQPAGLAFDPGGNLYVLDTFARVLYFTRPFATTSQPAVRVLGINPRNTQNNFITPYPNNFTLGAANVNGQIVPPSGIFMVGSNLFVTDSLSNRVVHYGLPADWAPETTAFFSPTLVGNALGQLDFISGKANREKVQPDATTLALPVAGAALGNEIWIVDAGNNRVLSFPQDAPLTYNAANRVVGQTEFNFNQPNLIEGRELNFGAGTGGGIAFDRNSNPPRMYVADLANHRILGFRDGRNVLPGAKADLVIGQPDMFHAVINFPNGAAGPPSDSSLSFPAGVAVDADGNLIVADTLNGRVLRFPSPFTQPSGTIRANLVLGQASFTSFVTDPSSQNMARPWGVAILADGSIAASDIQHNRVLIFRKPRNGDFTNFQRAEAVIGQSDFSTLTAGDGSAQLNQPRHMGVDTSDRLYVADALNNRVQIFVVSGPSIPNGLARSATVAGLNRPQAVVVSPATGEAFIANSGGNQVARVPEYQTILLTGATITASLVSNGPVDLALDPFDNLVVAEGVNRLAFFYAKATFQHAASFNQFGIAPGQLTYLYRLGKPFSLTEQTIDGSQQNPWPVVLGDLQITVNGTPGRIFQIIPSRIDFQVPQNAPTNGNADFVVTRVSTGEIIAAASLPMVPTNPGFFTRGTIAGTGQIAATDSTGKVNEATSPVKVNNYITLYLTGLGVVPNAPPDGVSPAGLGAFPAPLGTQVIINGTTIDLSKDPNAYSGLGAFPGGWQINVKVPGDVQCPNGPPICTAITTFVIYNSIISNNGPNPNTRIVTTITTAQ